MLEIKTVSVCEILCWALKYVIVRTVWKLAWWFGAILPYSMCVLSLIKANITWSRKEKRK
jgi:hypothetical protein